MTLAGRAECGLSVIQSFTKTGAASGNGPPLPLTIRSTKEEWGKEYLGPLLSDPVLSKLSPNSNFFVGFQTHVGERWELEKWIFPCWQAVKLLKLCYECLRISI